MRWYGLFLCFVVFHGAAGAQDKEIPVRWSLQNLAGAKSFEPGDRITLQLTAQIEPGWHLYATTQSLSAGPRPTQITLPEGQPFKLIEVIEPKPRVEFDRNFQNDIAWHTGVVSFKLALAIADQAPRGQNPLQVQVSFQACNSEKCLALRKELLSLPILIESASAKRPAPLATSRPVEEKTYLSAFALTEPMTRVAALEKFLVEYPHTPFALPVTRAIFETLIQSFPAQREKILAQARNLIDGASSETTRSNWLNLIANTLLEAGIYLDEAQGFSEQSVALLGNRQHLGQLQKIGEVEGRSILVSNVPKVATLGRIYLQRGRTPEAASLLKEAFAADPQNTAALIGMGELAAAKGDLPGALNYFASASFNGVNGQAARKRLENAYRKLYPEQGDQMETWLDAKYRADFPSPLTVIPYAPAPAHTNRIVLAEVFTGANCGPCLGSDLAVEALLKRYSTDHLAVLMYHVPIPTADPLSNAASEERKRFYEVHSAPTVLIDGALQDQTGSDREHAQGGYDRLNAAIEKSLTTPARATIDLSAVQAETFIKVKVEVTTHPSKNIQLHLMLVEEEVRYSGTNGVRFHPMTVRAMAEEGATGMILSEHQKNSFAYTFDVAKIKKSLNEGAPGEKRDEGRRWGIVAFLQDIKTKQILQAAYFKPAFK